MTADEPRVRAPAAAPDAPDRVGSRVRRDPARVTQGAARLAHGAALLLFAVYALDVLAGKIATVSGAHWPLRLGDVGEFVVVLAMSVAFVAGIVLGEQESAHREPPSTPHAGDAPPRTEGGVER